MSINIKKYLQKHLSLKNVQSTVIDVAKAIRNKPLRFLSIIGLDFIFLCLFSLSNMLILNKLYLHIKALFDFMGAETGGLLQSSGDMNFVTDPTFVYHFEQSVMYVGISLGIFLLLWLLLQGLSWSQSQRLLYNLQAKKYLLRFFGITFIYAGIIAVFAVFIFNLFFSILMDSSPTISPLRVLDVYKVAIPFMVLFAMLGYAQEDTLWRSFKKGLLAGLQIGSILMIYFLIGALVKKVVFAGWAQFILQVGLCILFLLVGLLLKEFSLKKKVLAGLQILPVIFLIILAFMFVDLLLMGIFKINAVLAFILGFTIFMPYVAVSRLLILKAVRK